MLDVLEPHAQPAGRRHPDAMAVTPESPREGAGAQGPGGVPQGPGLGLTLPVSICVLGTAGGHPMTADDPVPATVVMGTGPSPLHWHRALKLSPVVRHV